MFWIVTGSVAAAFFAGVYSGQKVKDWIAGVPSQVRAQVSVYEAKILADIKTKF